VTTGHGDHSRRGVEEIFTADRTIAFSGPLDTAMGVSKAYRNTNIASLAVDIVLAEALSPPAYTTIITMVDSLTAVIIPELAYIAVIPCRLLTTVLAMFASRLWSAASHTEHVLSFSTVQVV